MRKADHEICTDAYIKLAQRTRDDYINGEMSDEEFKRRRADQDRIYDARWLRLLRKDFPKHLHPTV